MNIPVFFKAIEESGLSIWVRESDSLFGFYFVLLMHNLGLALLAGTTLLVGLRLFGVAPDLPLAPLKDYIVVFWTGVWTSIVSGILLLIAYPTKALTNPLFYVKLIFVAAGLWITTRMVRAVFGNESASEEARVVAGRSLAVQSLAAWIAALSAGRLLAYTYSHLMYPGPR
jgi:hypothetical protein